MSAYIVVLEITRGLIGPEYRIRMRDPLAPDDLTQIAPPCVSPAEIGYVVSRLKAALDRLQQRVEQDFKQNWLKTKPERKLIDCQT
jgi:hypothetical protein